MISCSLVGMSANCLRLHVQHTAFMSLAHVLFLRPLKMTRKKSYYIYQILFRQKLLNITYMCKDVDNFRRKFYFSRISTSTLLRMNLDGRACVLRTICEAADVTISDSGLAGEVLHILLT